jgi:hypothetical protein
MKTWAEATRRERIERLENLLRVLRNLTPHQRRKHWDMNTWGYNTECGTVACAAGHAGLDPWFRRRGFVLQPAASVDDIVTCSFPGLTPSKFFGTIMSDSVFTSCAVNTVNQAIRATERCLKDLKKGEDI